MMEMEKRTNRRNVSEWMRSSVRVSTAGQVTALAVAACALLLLTVTVYAAIPDKTSDSTFFATNPELMIVGRYSTERSDSAYMAANPELMIAARYSAETSDSAYMAANPELGTAHGYYGAKTAAASDLMFPRRPVLSYDAGVAARLAYPRRPVLRYDPAGACGR
jgi:hypothetical protein